MALAIFCGMNTPIMADLNLPMCQHKMQSWEEIYAVLSVNQLQHTTAEIPSPKIKDILTYIKS